MNAYVSHFRGVKSSSLPEQEQHSLASLSAANMPPKNVSTRLNPIRLQTINHLRVRRPNQQEQNPCVTVMSSMLST